MLALVFRVLGACSVAFAAVPGQAAIQVFLDDLDGFNMAAGFPPIAVTFDDRSLGDISNRKLGGVTFVSPVDTPLIVVDAADTGVFTATSGARILSPGGAVLADGPDEAQRDSITFLFNPKVYAFGLDVLYQQLDADSLPSFEITDREGHTVAQGALDLASSTRPGHFFIGFVTDTPLDRISTLSILDNDDGLVSPGSNLAYDSLRIRSVVPEPAAWALMIAGFGLAGAMMRRRGLARG